MKNIYDREIRSKLDAENKLGLFMSIEEEHAYFDEVCTRIINNPRFYLDNLEDLYVFRVSFIKYKSVREQLKYIEKPKPL